MTQWGKLASASRLLRRTFVQANSPHHARAFSSSPHPSESFLSGTNNVYVEEMYKTWSKDPTSVHKSWDVYFRQVDQGAVPGEAFIPPPTVQSGVTPVARSAAAAVNASTDINHALGLSYLIRAYQSRGHEVAKLDPLGLDVRPSLPELDISMYGFTEADLDKTISIPKNFASGVTGFLEELSDGQNPTLGYIVQRLKETYTSSIGVQYMHISDREKCNWIRTNLESLVKKDETKAKKLHILERLAFSVVFERFLGNKYNTTKRFGLDGGESLIPGLKYMIDRATELGMEHVVIGMPHRGRLNVLSNVIRKPIHQIFKEFQGTHVDIDKYSDEHLADWSNSGDVKYHLGTDEHLADWSNSGDVKYHLGTSFDRTYPDGRQVHLSLVANPSHLEAVNPVVVGKCRAKQFYLGNDDVADQKVLPLLLHGDAAFSGQGVVYETMHLAELENYDTGGTIHVVVNNQIGFTTDPKNSRYAMNVPIFHVNGDDPLAVVKVFELAAEWRQKWRSDVIVNLTCYRKFGHNEIDNPFFTQPLMYKKIGSMPNVLESFSDQLVASNVASKAEVDAVVQKVWDFYGETFEESKTWEDSKKSDWLANKWESFKSPTQQSRIRPTGMDIDKLNHIGAQLTSIPNGFQLNTQLKRILAAKAHALKTGEGLDWGTAEALAWGGLLLEGNHVRISGQDVERGTFSHRHAVLHDQDTNQEHVPLNTLAKSVNPATAVTIPGEHTQAPFVASNSSLSEFAVLGFQTDDDPNVVPPMDESNRMQIQQTNWQVVYCSTPAQYFHALRRQIHRDFRKPLISVQPKSLLRLKQASSNLADLGPGTKFHRLLPDPSSNLVADDQVKRVVFCTGKLYYELAAEREEHGINDIALVRVEQIAPFPFDKVAEQAAKYKNAEIKWVQEEPENMGFWTYVSPRIETALTKISHDSRRPTYIGRPTSAAPATGYGAVHVLEQNRIVKKALGLPVKKSN
ncbi:hypothetical protein DYB31_002406 [Aphanomyces astaci]|uniref:2-oxoglutarate dehydrogenase, mitochondrial n=2 Tax=Aphanomyces astaci TaxID=112090 RepID=A0A397F9S8_APHAT|nr:hypothetical protein DYB31_002406 [Aphanomyces astaci]